jgi:hypothetical protein
MARRPKRSLSAAISAVAVSEPRLKTMVTRPICRLSTPKAARRAGTAGATTAASRAAMKTPTNRTVRIRLRATSSSEAVVGEASGATAVMRET